jgi:hypothetical protein
VTYLKCVPCQVRVSRAEAAADFTDGSCPHCGQPLEPVGKPAEVLGYRSPELHDSSVPARVADISGGRAAADAQLAADRWLDDGGNISRGSISPEALAEAVALPRPRTGP